MNDHRIPPDEAASAFLDGELGAEEAETVRRHPRLAARARALRRAAEAVGDPVAPPPGAADAAVEAALADFDARRGSAAELAQRRPRGLSVITGVAAAVAIGFIVAAAVGLFAERGADDDADTAAAPAPPPAAAAVEAAPAPAPEAPPPPPEPAPALELPPPAAPPATTLPSPPAVVVAPAADEVEAPGSEATAAEPGTALAEAQAQADDASAAAAAQAEAAPAAEPEPPAAHEMEALDDTGPLDAVLAAPTPEEACAGAIGGRTVEARLTVGDAPILVLGTPDAPLAALDGTTCVEIPPPDGTEMVADEAPDGCAGAIGDGTVEARLIFSGTRILVVRTVAGSLTALDGTTCGGIPAG